MGQAIFEDLRLYADTYNAEGYSSVNHLSKGLATQSDILNPIVTHLYYTSANYGSKNFPLSFLTEGMKNMRAIKSADMSYKTYILGKPKKTSTVASNLYSASDKPGQNGTEFTIVFADRWFSKSQTLNWGRDVQVRVQRDPVKKGSNYEYSVVLITNDKAEFCPVEALQAGVRWSRGIHKVGIEDSVGVEHRSQSPGMMMNQLSLVRNTYKIKGNVENKVMVFEIKADNKVMKYWCEWELFMNGLDWKERCEDDLWNSRYNRTADGEILNRDDDSNQVIPSGAGLIQQIPNEDTYSFMTTEKLKQVVRDVLFNASDSTQRRIEVFTGLGGLEEASDAMANAAASLSLVDDGRFVEGKGNNLVYGAYFKTFRHIDGHTVTFRYLPLLDNGSVAQASEKHPKTGLPMESYSMYFVDMSTYDGEANVQYVYEEGRKDREFVVPGASVPKGYGDTPFRATSRDASTMEWMKTQGICIKRPTNCFKLFNDLS